MNKISGNNPISFQGSFKVGVLTKRVLKKKLGSEFQTFMDKGHELARQSGFKDIKLNIFSLFPFLSKVKAKFSFVNAEGKKEVQTIKTKLKYLKQKPKEFIDNIMNKFENLIPKAKETYKTCGSSGKNNYDNFNQDIVFLSDGVDYNHNNFGNFDNLIPDINPGYSPTGYLDDMFNGFDNSFDFI